LREKQQVGPGGIKFPQRSPRTGPDLEPTGLIKVTPIRFGNQQSNSFDLTQELVGFDFLKKIKVQN
jgi:hypothetical protein